jgi:RNA polymerase sigma factor (sigma-70 family)
MSETDPLSFEEEQRLVRIAQSTDPCISQKEKDAARNKVICAIELAAWKEVAKLLKLSDASDERREELKQEAMLVLTEKFYKFNPDRGYRYLTYAAWWVRQAIRRYNWATCGNIRLPNQVSSLLHKAKKLTDTEILQGALAKAKLKMSPAKMVEFRKHATRARSCKSIYGVSEDKSYSESILLASNTGPLPKIERQEVADFVYKVLAAMSETHREVLLLRQTKTLKAIGDMKSLSRERIRQLEAVARRNFRLIAARMNADMVADLVIENDGKVKEPSVAYYLSVREAKVLIKNLGGTDCLYDDVRKAALKNASDLTADVFMRARRQLYSDDKPKKGDTDARHETVSKTR